MPSVDYFCNYQIVDFEEITPFIRITWIILGNCSRYENQGCYCGYEHRNGCS